MAARDFAHKLKVTAALLGCATQKDLCLLFRKVNPATEFDLERSYNWMQGRSRPRSATVYEDWAALLGTGRPTSFLRSCSIEEFHAALAERFQLSPAEVAQVAANTVRLPVASARQAPAYLAGAFACYSHALSPHFRGRIIRGSLEFVPAAANHGAVPLLAAYTETLAFGRVELRGAVELSGQSIYLDLAEPTRGLRLFMILFLPSPPAGVLAGVLPTATFLDSFAQPASSRIALVRIPGAGQAALANSERYIDLAEEPLSRDLAALGTPLGGADAEQLDRLLEGFLRTGAEPGARVDAPADAYAALTLAVDRLMV